MPKRAIVRLGDRTTHGGTVVTAHPTYQIYGKGVARVGDKVDCPQCAGTHKIVSGAPTVWSTQDIARHDDETSCGAKLIASQSKATIDDEAGAAPAAASGASTLPAAAPALAPSAPDAGAAPSAPVPEAPASAAPHALRFQAIDPGTGEPAPECVYLLVREDGTQHGGVTDAEGYTEVIETMRPEEVAVHFQFKSPKGEQIAREDLTA